MQYCVKYVVSEIYRRMQCQQNAECEVPKGMKRLVGSNWFWGAGRKCRDSNVTRAHTVGNREYQILDVTEMLRVISYRRLPVLHFKSLVMCPISLWQMPQFW